MGDKFKSGCLVFASMVSNLTISSSLAHTDPSVLQYCSNPSSVVHGTTVVRETPVVLTDWGVVGNVHYPIMLFNIKYIKCRLDIVSYTTGTFILKNGYVFNISSDNINYTKFMPHHENNNILEMNNNCLSIGSNNFVCAKRYNGRYIVSMYIAHGSKRKELKILDTDKYVTHVSFLQAIHSNSGSVNIVFNDNVYSDHLLSIGVSYSN